MTWRKQMKYVNLCPCSYTWFAVMDITWLLAFLSFRQSDSDIMLRSSTKTATVSQARLCRLRGFTAFHSYPSIAILQEAQHFLSQAVLYLSDFLWWYHPNLCSHWARQPVVEHVLVDYIPRISWWNFECLCLINPEALWYCEIQTNVPVDIRFHNRKFKSNGFISKKSLDPMWTLYKN